MEMDETKGKQTENGILLLLVSYYMLLYAM